MITPTTSKPTTTNSSGYPNMTLGTNHDFVAERSATKSRKTPRVYSNKSKSPERTRAPARRTGARRRPQRLYYTDPDLMTTGLHEGIRSHETTHPTSAPPKLGFKISRKQLITGFSVLATVIVFSLCCCTDHGKQAIRRLLARNNENPQLLRSPAFTDVMVYDKKMRCVRLDRRRLQGRRHLGRKADKKRRKQRDASTNKQRNARNANIFTSEHQSNRIQEERTRRNSRRQRARSTKATACPCGNPTMQKIWTRFGCDVCGNNPIPKDTWMLGCRPCNWGMCPDCMNRSVARSGRQPKDLSREESSDSVGHY